MSRWRIARLLPRRTVRLRLTVWYGGLFVLSGAVMLTITNLLVRHATGNYLFFQSSNDGNTSTGVIGTGGAPPPAFGGPFVSGPAAGTPPVTTQGQDQAARVLAEAHRQHTIEVHQLFIQSLIALAIMAVVSVGLGWLVAGRALRPLRTITTAARNISANNLHQRLALAGPNDELKELGDTFDALIARLDRSFQSQRQFVANASHELRTPLTLQHALLEAALLDPDQSLQSWRTTGRRALAANQEQERLIAALLTLARSERGLSRREPFDLSVITTAVLAGREADFAQRGLRLSATLSAAPIAGDPALAERLVANLIDNASRHNVRGGRVDVTTAVQGSDAVLSVSNTGPVLAPSEIDRLFEPFQRAIGDRTAHDGGLGLGLSIVQAIATAHDASISASARPDGGLDIAVPFPAIRPSDATAGVQRVQERALSNNTP